MYVKTVYMVRLRLFPPDSKEIREVESAVFECAPPPAPAPQFCNTFHRYALLLLLSCARAGEPPAVAKKVLLWSIEAAQKGKQAS